MKTTDDIVLIAKKMLTKYGRLEPKLVIEGSAGLEAVPLPDLPKPAKLSVLEALGYTLAKDDRIGNLAQLFLVAEGWRSSRNGPHAALRPQHDPDRVECVMVFQYRAEPEARRMVVYDLVRNAAGEPTELKRLEQPNKEGSAVESPPLDALLRGFTRGRRRRDTGASAA